MYVYATNGVELENVGRVIRLVYDVISEFSLPLEVFDGRAVKSEDSALVEKLIRR